MGLVFDLLIIFLISFILPLIWFIYFSSKDKHPEPFLWIFIAFFLGMMAGVVSYYTEGFFSQLDISEKYLYFLNAFVEEFFKFLFVFIIIFPKKVFDEPVDGMVYMIASAFGFAFLENSLFLFSSFSSNAYFLKIDKYSLILLIGFFRFLGANLLHILSSALIGYGYSMALKVRRVFPFLISFISAWILHFIFNSIIIFSSPGSRIKDIPFYFNFIFLIPILWFASLVVIIELKKLVSLKND